jgi:hypothetical protein
LDSGANLLDSTTKDLATGTTGSSGFAPQPFLSTQAGFEAQKAFESQMAAEDRAFREDQQQAAEEAQLKLQIISGANQLAAQRSQQVQQARQLLAQTLGQDVIQGAALLQGGLGFGTTPNEAFRGQLQGFAETPTVGFDVNAPTPALQGQVDALREQVQGGPPQQPVIGFKHGGELPLNKEATILVGEAGPEILDIGKGKLRVRPVDATAQFGGSFGFGPAPSFGGEFGTGFEPTQAERTLTPLTPGNAFGPGASRESIAAVAAPLFQHLGFNTVPFGVRRRGVLRPLSLRNAGGDLSQMGLSFAGLNALGVNPRLFRFGTGVYFRDREGNLQKFRDMEQFDELGFRRTDITQVAPSGTELAGLRAEIADAPVITGRPITGEASTGFSAESAAPIFSPTTGLLLPNPAQFASLLRPGVLDPLARSAIASLYQDANISPEALAEGALAFTPTGTATGEQVGFG